jgi:hypothetical protein
MSTWRTGMLLFMYTGMESLIIVKYSRLLASRPHTYKIADGDDFSFCCVFCL